MWIISVTPPHSGLPGSAWVKSPQCCVVVTPWPSPVRSLVEIASILPLNCGFFFYFYLFFRLWAYYGQQLRFVICLTVVQYMTHKVCSVNVCWINMTGWMFSKSGALNQHKNEWDRGSYRSISSPVGEPDIATLNAVGKRAIIRDGNVVSQGWGLNKVAENIAKIILLYGYSMICSQ